MNLPSDDPTFVLRRTVYALLIVLSIGTMLGRILAVDSVDYQGLERARIEKIPDELAQRREQYQKQGVAPQEIERRLAKIEDQLWRRAKLRRPFLSANDRSRWATVRALVEPEMRVPGAPYAIDKVIQEPGWDTIDMVKHDGHYYSSKPPLLPTIMAAEYWLIYNIAGADLGTRPHAVGRFMLVTLNVLPMALYFALVALLIERFGKTDFSRVFAVGAATFGTFLTTFAVVINNHLTAAIGTAVGLYAIVRILFDGEQRARYFVIAGLGVGFVTANELPALSLTVAGTAILFRAAPKKTLLFFLPAVLAIGAAFYTTNWIAHRSLRPPYAHRSATDKADNWYDYEYERNGKTYKSYWLEPVGVDRGEPSRAVYALHVLVGHHGLFSLTPVWLLTAAGLAMWIWKPGDRRLRDLALLIAVLSLVCLAFYILRPLNDRNYGGMTSGLRWMFWFAPMWLVAMLPAVDAMAQPRWRRVVVMALLLISVLSAAYPTWNPWTHPWLLDFFHEMGWIRA